MGQSDDGDGGKDAKTYDTAAQLDFFVMQDLGEYGVVFLHSGSEDAPRYSTVYQTVIGNV